MLSGGAGCSLGSGNSITADAEGVGLVRGRGVVGLGVGVVGLGVGVVGLGVDVVGLGVDVGRDTGGGDALGQSA